MANISVKCKTFKLQTWLETTSYLLCICQYAVLSLCVLCLPHMLFIVHVSFLMVHFNFGSQPKMVNRPLYVCVFISARVSKLPLHSRKDELFTTRC